MFVEPATVDPEGNARKLAANPKLKIPPHPRWILDGNDRAIDFEQEGLTFYRRVRKYLAAVFYNAVVTYLPSHTIRKAYLRLFGATIGKDSTIMRGTKVFDIEYMAIGDRTYIGNRCLLDCRAGLAIGDNVVIASDTHIIGARHAVNHRDFLAVIAVPLVIEDYVWIARRAMILPSHVHRGAVVAEQATVTGDVGELEIVAGTPARAIGKRNPDALKCSGKMRPEFA